jgi:hypothetical protein
MNVDRHGHARMQQIAKGQSSSRQPVATSGMHVLRAGAMKGVAVKESYWGGSGGVDA